VVKDGRAHPASTTLSWQGPFGPRSCQGLRGCGDGHHQKPRQASAITHGQKKILASFECEAIKAVKNANFRFGTASHLANARAIGLANRSERAIQRNMAEYGVRMYIIKQKKYILKSSIKKRVI
jgi:hypothetical protein